MLNTYFIDKQGRRWKVVLGLREVINKYTSENMAAVLLEVFKDYKISSNIGYFIADNADLNNIYIDIILRALYPNILLKKRKACCLYCFGYIVNLYIQAFIVGKDVEKICKELTTAYREMDFKKINKF